MGKKSIGKKISEAKQVQLLNERCEFLYQEQQDIKTQLNADGVEIAKLRERVAELEDNVEITPKLITP